MSLPTYHAQQSLMLHKRYNLSVNAKALLRSHDDWKLGRIDQDELGRMVRMSPNMRQAIIDTITKVNNVMKKKPEESKMCIDIIQACTEIMTALGKPPVCPFSFVQMSTPHLVQPSLVSRLTCCFLAEKTPDLRGFPLMRLPAEVRRGVYKQYLNGFITPKTDAATHPKTTKCTCAGFVPPGYHARKFDLSLARTSKRVRDEFLQYFYQDTRLYFTCGCELRERLTNNLMRLTARSIKVHWTGPECDKAFLLLAKCPRLKKLEIAISRSTTGSLTVRETEMRKYFTSGRQPRIADALGMDELLLIRGLDEVTASHLPIKHAARKTEDERASLQGLLRYNLMLPRTADDGDDDYDSPYINI